MIKTVKKFGMEDNFLIWYRVSVKNLQLTSNLMVKYWVHSLYHKEQCKDFYFYYFNITVKVVKVEILAVFLVLEEMCLIFHIKRKIKKEKVIDIGKKEVKLPLFIGNMTINVENLK